LAERQVGERLDTPVGTREEDPAWLVAAEPFKIKVVEPIRRTSRDEREKLIAKAGFNLFSLRSGSVYIDLLTDSGTTAMSDSQWAALMLGDEAYAGSRSFYRLKSAVAEVMGFPLVIPTHQGRAAENVLFTTMLKPGDVVPNNMHFDTTQAHVEYRGAEARNLVRAEAYDPVADLPFKGDMDLVRLEQTLAGRKTAKNPGGESIPVVLMTVTCNSGGGQPVSMGNLRAVSEICRRHKVPFFLDAARFAENAYFIKTREPGYASRPIREIVREMFSYAEGCTMSGKKDCLVNIGGFIALRRRDLYDKATVWAVLFEGFPTYGGLAGRDMEAMAQGLLEVTDEDYLAYRVGQVGYLARRLKEAGVPIIEPAGGHAVYLDALRFLPAISRDRFPAQALAVELYVEGGVRGVEIGAVLAGRDPKTGENRFPGLEMVRLAVPRRVYTRQHLDVVVETCRGVLSRREKIGGLAFKKEPPVLRHFTATFRRVD
jgi:tyrosine phenol-lyase